MNINLDNIRKKFVDSGYPIPESFVEKLSAQLVNCVDGLRPNIAEWIDSKPFSDIWIRNKYCLNVVLKIRGNPTSPIAVANAILALNAYAENTANEHLLWQTRM